jgi:hypothetical protein
MLDNGRKELHYDYWWDSDNSDGSWIARTHGLKSPQSIMRCTRESDGGTYMSQSGSKYYLWELIEGEIWEIVTSMDLVDIMTEMGKTKYGSLKIEKVDEA